MEDWRWNTMRSRWSSATAGFSAVMAVLLVGDTTVNTVGVSAEQGIWAAAIWMALVAGGAAVLIARSLRERSI
jgi:hypothetical protein